MLKSTSDKILDEMLRHMSNVALLIKVAMNLQKGFSVKDKTRGRNNKTRGTLSNSQLTSALVEKGYSLLMVAFSFPWKVF